MVPTYKNENKNLLLQYLESKFGKSSSSVLDGILAWDFKEHQPSITRGVKEVKEFAATLLRAFPDEHFSIEDEVIENDKAVFRYEWHATHSGQFMNWAPTNNQVSTVVCC